MLNQVGNYLLISYQINEDTSNGTTDPRVPELDEFFNLNYASMLKDLIGVTLASVRVLLVSTSVRGVILIPVSMTFNATALELKKTQMWVK